MEIKKYATSWMKPNQRHQFSTVVPTLYWFIRQPPSYCLGWKLAFPHSKTKKHKKLKNTDQVAFHSGQ